MVLLAALWIGGFAALFAWIYLRHAVNAGGPHGWVVREDGAHLLINLRPHLNTHFDSATPSVLVQPQRRVRGLRVVYRGGYEGLGAAWGEFCGWIEAEGLSVQDRLWECYLAGPESGSDPDQWRTELSRPMAP